MYFFTFLDQGKHMTMVKTYGGLARLALANDNLDGAMSHIETGLDMVKELLDNSITHAELLALKGDIELDDTTDQGNSLRGIDKKTVGREVISISLLMYYSQSHTFFNETKQFKITVFFRYNLSQTFSELKPCIANKNCKKLFFEV
jgi:hypothetical protein